MYGLYDGMCLADQSSIVIIKEPLIAYKFPMGCVQANTMNATGEGLPATNQKLEQDLEYELSGPKLVDKYAERAEESAPGGGQLVDVSEETEEAFMATKPWIGALVAPNTKPQIDMSPPNKSLSLQFVNGFKVEDSRQIMFWTNKPNTVVYCAAALGINMKVDTLQQRFMGSGSTSTANGHTDDIMALGVSPNRQLVVTGSLGATPGILLWDAETLEIKGRTKLGRNTRAVSTIRFSKNGDYFFCSDKHNDSNVYCYSAKDMSLLAKDKCGSDAVIDAETGANSTYACATKSGLWFFQYSEGGGIKKNRGIFGSSPRNAMCCVAYAGTQNCFLSGSIDGSIYFWDGISCTKVRPTHEGSVMTIAWSEDVIYSSGFRDNLLKLSTIDGQIIKTYTLPSYAKNIDAFNKRILVGTKCGRMITIDGDTQKEIMHGHWTGETWGLSIDSAGIVYTTADDNTVLAFNPKTKKVEKEGVINKVPGKKYKIGGASTLSLLPPNQQARGIATNKAGHVALGLNDGQLSIRTTQNLGAEIFNDKSAKQWIQVLKYSPDEKRLAVGSHDNNIYIYNANGNSYTLKGALKAHKSFITQLDWSKDGRFMQSVCGAYELLFWDVENLRQLTGGATQLRDEHWATYTVKLGWWVQGVFPPATDGSHVNGVDRTKDEKIIVTADDWGLVNLYKNPCMKVMDRITQGARASSFRAHSSHVVRANFDQSDQFLYSIGGYDKTLMMWKVT